MTRLHEGERVVDLSWQFLARRFGVIHHKNVEQFQVEPFEHSLKRWIILKDVHVCIDRMKLGEGSQSLRVDFPWCRLVLRGTEQRCEHEQSHESEIESAHRNLLKAQGA